jgi:hypothetical protein
MGFQEAFFMTYYMINHLLSLVLNIFEETFF